MVDVNFLNPLGSKKTKAGLRLNNVEAILYEWAGQLIKDSQDNLNKAASVASGKLASTMKIMPINFAGGAYTLKISLEDYYDFINKGVSGVENRISSPYSFKSIYPSKLMTAQILKWIRQGKTKVLDKKPQKQTYGNLEKKNKGLYNMASKTNSLKSIAYAVSTNIKKRGIKATHFLDDAVKVNYPKLKKDIENALKEDLKIVIKQLNVE